jgi:hypothetical protein
MVNKDSSEWEIIEKKALDILELCQGCLSHDTIKFVKEYLGHAEYEMAIEGLFIDIMQLPTVPDALESKMCIDLAKSVGLDKEVVYLPDFWTKLLNFCHEKLKT